MTPALLTRMSSLPHFSTTPSTTFSTLSRLVDVAGKRLGLAAGRVIASTVSASFSGAAGDAGDLRAAAARGPSRSPCPGLARRR